MPLSRKEYEIVKRRAKEFWDSLGASERWVLGDQLVFGEYFWGDWMDKKPPVGFWTEVDRLRMAWEEEQS